MWCRVSYVASVSVRALDTQTTLQHLLLYLRCHSGRAFVCTFISLIFFLSSKAAVYLEQRGRSIAYSFDELSVAKHRQLSLFLSRRLSSFYLFAGFSVCPLSQSRPIFHPVSRPRPWGFSFKDTLPFFISFRTNALLHIHFFYLLLANRGNIQFLVVEGCLFDTLHVCAVRNRMS